MITRKRSMSRSLIVSLILTTTIVSAQSPREVLSKEALNARAWALAALETSVPPDIRNNLSFLREALLDEGKAAPPASAPSYQAGSLLCDALVATLDEHDQAAVKAGYRAAQAEANTRVTNQSLDAHAPYRSSWPQYARIKDQRAEIQRQQDNKTALAREQVKVDWSNRSAVLGKGLDDLYQKYREALRQDAIAQKPVMTSVTPKVEAPVPNTGGAAITIFCSEEARILPLETGQETIIGSDTPHRIKSISPELAGWQFVAVPWHTNNTYEIRVNQDGVLYAFGGGPKNNDRRILRPEERSKWEAADSAIRAPAINFCIRRKVTAGESFKLDGLQLMFAARSIQLVPDGKLESATQPIVPSPAPEATAPRSAAQPDEP